MRHRRSGAIAISVVVAAVLAVWLWPREPLPAPTALPTTFIAIAPPAPEPSLPRWARPRVGARRLVAGVVTHDGGGVAGARVRWISPGDEPFGRIGGAVTTDEDGRFRLGMLLPEALRISVSAPGLAPVALVVDLRRPAVAPPPDALVVELNDCEVLLALEAVDSGGGPISGMSTRLRTTGGNEVGFTDQDGGKATICGHARDTLEIVVDGYATAFVSLPGGPRGTARVIMVPEGTITGRVTDRGGAPVADARVTLDRDPGLVTVTDAEGRFQLGGLPAGSYRVFAEADRGTARSPLPVDVRAAEAIPVELVLEPTASVSGKVVDEQKRPVAGVVLAFRRLADDATSRDDATDAEGRFLVEGVPLGRVRAVSGQRLLDDAPFDVPAAGREGIVVVARAPARLGGVVRRDGAPVAGAEVALTTNWRVEKTVRTGADGRFALDRPPFGAGTLIARFEDLVSPRTFVQVPDSGDVEVELTLDDAVFLDGLVSNRAGRPVPDARVVDVASRSSGLTGPDGRFHVGPVSPGRKRVMVERLRVAAPLYTLVAPADGFVDPELDARLVVDDEEYTLRGVVVFGGQGVADASVRVTSPSGLRQSTLSGPDGTFEFAEVTAGSHDLLARHGEREGQATATVPSDRPTQVEIQTGARMNGHVRGAEGRVWVGLMRKGRSGDMHGGWFVGHYVLTGIPPGSYMLFAHSGKKQAMKEVEVTTGVTLELDLELQLPEPE